MFVGANDLKHHLKLQVFEQVFKTNVPLKKGSRTIAIMAFYILKINNKEEGLFYRTPSPYSDRLLGTTVSLL